MNYAEAKEHAKSVLFDTDLAAQTATYDDGVSPTQVSAMIKYGGSGTGRTADQATITVLKSEVPSPQYGHKITFDGIEWVIDQNNRGDQSFSGNDFTWQLPAMKDQRVSPWQR
ncbi:MAG TPA: hypothetical protein DHV36_16170 [Desulfobacteraceae bacterium]|nr:hypothetical protein [Desulfobacteraceae bacterium]|tara:strand:- start:266 stop:604 length:339 start_codon:yes stop_codon:yes gene_type:complete